MPQLSQMGIDLNNSLTVTFSDELQIKLEYDLPPHLKSAATVPREI